MRKLKKIISSKMCLFYTVFMILVSIVSYRWVFNPDSVGDNDIIFVGIVYFSYTLINTVSWFIQEYKR